MLHLNFMIYIYTHALVISGACKMAMEHEAFLEAFAVEDGDFIGRTSESLRDLSRVAAF